jgi:hypothetical protein
MGISYGVDPNWAVENANGRTHIATKGIVQDGLVFNIDIGSANCYPGSGSTITDLQGNHNFSMINSPAYSGTDNYGAIVFDGVNDFLQVTGGISSGSAISLTNNFTIEQIFKPTAYQPSAYFSLTNMLLQKGTASTYNYATQPSNDTTFAFIKRTSPEDLQFHNFTVPSMLNKVNVVTIVVQNGNDSANDTVSCYYNSVFINTLSISGSAIAAVNNDPLYFGGLGDTTYTEFTGSLYAIRIYNKALSQSEITKNFNASRRRFGL